MSELATTIRSLRWIRIVSAGAAIALSTFAFIYLAVYVYVISYPIFGQGEAGLEQLENVVGFVGSWGARLFFLVVVVMTASWTAHTAGEATFRHGVLTGLTAAVVSQVIVYFLYPPVELFELSVYMTFGLAGGWLGGLDAERSLAGEESLYRASQQISTARNPDNIAAAIGEHLGETEEKSVIIWHLASYSADSLENWLEPWAFWTSLRNWKKRRQVLRAEAFSVPTVEDLSNPSPTILRSEDLPSARRAAWKQRDVRSAFVMPLAAPGEVRVGLLVVEFRKRRRLSRAEIREYLTIGAQAALALKNLQLVEQAQRSGEQAGVLLERQRLSHEIHDTLAQGFASILISLTAMELTQPSSHTSSESSRRHLEEARNAAQENLTEARRLVWALHPEPLERYSLPEALERLIGEWSEQLGVEASVTIVGSRISLRPETEISLFRIAQEALTNVRKHAGAEQVRLTLSYVEDSVILEVLDDGVGFDTTETNGRDEPGFGLIAMRERVEQLGGMFSIESVLDKGTTLTARLPTYPQTESGVEKTIEREKTR